ncbi:WD repeat-containing protein 31 isoform X2 [Lepisosteus oculatus]|uniref:WD repeat-containing protein 31 isoform X2 n=1 Tax=Lepisosteus oculatus TaxID=7918 RepID=UPI00371A1A17
MGKRQSKVRRRTSAYRAVTGAEDSSPGEQEVQYSAAHSGAVNSVAALTSDLCVSGGSDKAVVVYNWRSGRLYQRLQGHTREVTKVGCVYSSGRVFSSSRDKTVLMWDLDRGDQPVGRFCGHDLVVSGLAVSPDGSRLCTGSRDNSLCLWDIESGEMLLKNTISRNLVTHLCWVPGGSCILQTSEDKTIRLWDSRCLGVASAFPAKQHIQTHCDVSPDARYCLSCSNGFGGQGCEATLWDLRQTGAWACEYRGHLHSASCCLFLPARPGEPPALATSSHDGSVRVWDQSSAACLAALQLDGSGPLSSLAAGDAASLLCAAFNTGVHLLRTERGGRGVQLSAQARW